MLEIKAKHLKNNEIELDIKSTGNVSELLSELAQINSNILKKIESKTPYLKEKMLLDIFSAINILWEEKEEGEID